MADRKVTIDSTSWTQISQDGDTRIGVALPDGGGRVSADGTVDVVAVSVQAQSSDCALDKATWLHGARDGSEAANPLIRDIGTDEHAYAQWVAGHGAQYVVVV